MPERSGYSGVQIALHWVIAILIVLAWLSSEGAEEALEAAEKGAATGFVPHVALGISILTLVIFRAVIRVTRGVPSAPGTPGSWQVRAADWGHGLIYLLMVAVPLGGISAFFLGLETGDVHALFANLLMVIVLGHAVVALFHHYVLKDGLILRMLRPE